MGLDMYINNTSKGDNANREEVAYWRKEHDLHAVFEGLAEQKGIEYESFNCIPVPLTIEDIDYVLDIVRDPEFEMDYAREYTITTLIHCKFLAGTGAELEYDSWW